MTSATDQQDIVMSRNNVVNSANNGSILETFNNEEASFPFIPANMMAPVNSMHLNLPYTIRSTSGDILNQESQISDLFDINELFQGEFFPGDVDFSKYVNYPADSMGTPIFNEQPNYAVNSSHNQSTNSSSLAATIGATTKKGVLLIPPPLSRLPLPMVMSAKASNKLSAIRLNPSPGDNQTSNETLLVGSKRSIDQLSSEPSTKAIKTEPLTKSPTSANDIHVSPASKLMSEREMMDYQRTERRERNREHAKRSRIRKKLLLDSLQEQLMVLRRQNKLLRRVVVDRLRPDIATSLLSECTIPESDLLISMRDEDSDVESAHPAKANTDKAPPSSAMPKHITPKILMEADYRLIQSLVISQQNFVLSDPSLPDNPIVYASDGFCRMTGYKKQDVIGRNCRFLQGPGTDMTAVELIREGIRLGQDISVCLLNYKADGSPFWNQFFLAALKDATGSVVNFVGVQCEVNTIPVKELKDRVKKLPLPFEEMSASL